MALRLALFDCDGTLADSEASIVDAVHAAFGESGLEAPDRGHIVANIGRSLDAFLQHVAPELTPAEAGQLIDAYRGHFARLRAERGVDPLFPGLDTVLRQLRAQGVLLGIATGKSRRGLLHFLEAHGLEEDFAVLQTADDAPGKPHPGMIHNALDATGSSAGETVMIGDTTFDIGAARNAQVMGIGVSWGHHLESDLLEAGAWCVVHDAVALAERLESLRIGNPPG